MKVLYLFVFLYVFNFYPHFLFGQTEKISACLEITKLSEYTYIHSCNNNNGLIYIHNNEALIISTPSSDLETQNLINWVKSKTNIVGYIIDRWHPDAMGGLDVVHKNGIETYASNFTKLIAKEKKLTIPKIGFDEVLQLKVGGKKVISHYLGEAHTSDGIVVWLPSEKILFGGNEIRNQNGWIGNIADANLSEWSKTVQKIKEKYGTAKIVVPGHGSYGGVELIDYTIDLYSFPKNINCNNNFLSKNYAQDFFEGFNFYYSIKKKKIDKIIYSNSKVTFNKNNRKIEIYGAFIKYDPVKKSIFLPEGCIQISVKNKSESFSFNKLYATHWDNPLEFTLVIKEIK